MVRGENQHDQFDDAWRRPALIFIFCVTATILALLLLRGSLAPPDIAMVKRSGSWDFDPELGGVLTVTIYVRNKEGQPYVATMLAELIAKDSKEIRDSQTKDV